jgi:adenylate cyclase
MGEIAFSHKGTLDKHIGDSLMVIFGSPVSRDNDALRAVRCALAMQAKAREIDEQLQSKPNLRLQTGIGIATGKVYSGIMGSLRRKEFTSVGMPVNLAARLQSMARGGETLLNEATHQAVCSEVRAEPLPAVRVKGVDDPMPVYRIKS